MAPSFCHPLYDGTTTTYSTQVEVLQSQNGRPIPTVILATNPRPSFDQGQASERTTTRSNPPLVVTLSAPPSGRSSRPSPLCPNTNMRRATANTQLVCTSSSQLTPLEVQRERAKRGHIIRCIREWEQGAELKSCLYFVRPSSVSSRQILAKRVYSTRSSAAFLRVSARETERSQERRWTVCINLRTQLKYSNTNTLASTT